MKKKFNFTSFSAGKTSFSAFKAGTKSTYILKYANDAYCAIFTNEIVKHFTTKEKFLDFARRNW